MLVVTSSTLREEFARTCARGLERHAVTTAVLADIHCARTVLRAANASQVAASFAFADTAGALTRSTAGFTILEIGASRGTVVRAGAFG